MKIKLVHFPIYGLYLALFKMYAGPQALQQAIKILLLAGVLLYLLSHVPVKRLINGALPFASAVIISSVFGALRGYIGYMGILHGILHGLCIYAVYTLLQHCRIRGYEKDVIQCLLRITGVYCVISLISMALQGHSDDGTSITYFFGNKFATSYYFLQFTGLFFCRFWKKINQSAFWKAAYVSISLLTVLLCHWLYCSTAMLSAVVLLVMPFLPRAVKGFFTKPWVVLVCVIAAAVIPFVIVSILESEIVQYIVVEVLGENLTLTGRKKIYSKLAQVIMNELVFGYGYGNAAVMKAVGFGNAQNGLLQIMVDYGVAGTAAFVWLVYQCIRNARKGECTLGFYMLVYSMIVASIVEISYNYVFFVAVIALRWGIENEKKSPGMQSAEGCEHDGNPIVQ